MKMQKFALAGAIAALLAFSASGFADPVSTGSVSGKVSGPDGKPAAGAKVSLTSTANSKPTAEKPKKGEKKDDALSAVTDADGKFKIENVPSGPYSIRANAKGVGSIKSVLTVSAGNDFPITLQLKAPKKKA